MKKHNDSVGVDLDDIEGVDHERAVFIKGYLKAEMMS